MVFCCFLFLHLHLMQPMGVTVVEMHNNGRFDTGDELNVGKLTRGAKER